MLDFAAEKSAMAESSNQAHEWFVIDFCQLGFIGKMFKNTNLPVLIQVMAGIEFLKMQAELLFSTLIIFPLITISFNSLSMV